VEKLFMTEVQMGKRVQAILEAIAEIARENMGNTGRKESFDAVLLAYGQDMEGAVRLLNEQPVEDEIKMLISQIAVYAAARNFDAADRLIAGYRNQQLRRLKPGNGKYGL
jgi:hypothetical protein